MSPELAAGAAAAAGVLVTLIVVAATRVCGGGGPVRRRLAQLDELSRRLMRFEQALTVPRQRGTYGELLLEELLATWLPRSSYATQVTLPDGARVDAMVRLGQRSVPIDAKFPFEAVEKLAPEEPLTKAAERAIARHVAAVGDKYVVPDAGTYNFALLYVPSDASTCAALPAPQICSGRLCAAASCRSAPPPCTCTCTRSATRCVACAWPRPVWSWPTRSSGRATRSRHCWRRPSERRVSCCS